MRDRLCGAIGPRVYAGTIHAFCLMILRERASEAGLSPSFEIAGPDDIEATARSAWPEMSAAERRSHLDEMARTSALSAGAAIPDFMTRFSEQLRAIPSSAHALRSCAVTLLFSKRSGAGSPVSLSTNTRT
jgi:superfamily I DNA/RNA helicase